MKNITIIYSKNHMIHNPQWEIFEGQKVSHAERPERIESIISSIRQSEIGPVISPKSFPLRFIRSVHYRHYIDFIKEKSMSLNTGESLYPSYFIMDTYTPILPGTYFAAVWSVNTVLTGAELLEKNRFVFALCRPPGHHAETARMGGYCYFNNAAIAADYLSKKGKVAILDIDFHHGNGTQEIFYDRNDVFYISIHADPRVKFPYSSGFPWENGAGQGFGYTKNYPLPMGSSELIYQRFLQNALSQIKQFNPRYLIVSLGFDTYLHDPIGGFKLSIPFYKIIGRDIASLRIPTLLVQEGGYNVSDLGKLAGSFLEGITS